MAGQHSGGFPEPGTASSYGGFIFSRFNLFKLYQTVLAHDYAIERLTKAMTQANDDLTALELELTDGINAVAKEIDDLHAEIANGNTAAVSRLKPLADRLRDLSPGSTASPVVPPEAGSLSTAPSSTPNDPSNPAPTSGV